VARWLALLAVGLALTSATAHAQPVLPGVGVPPASAAARLAAQDAFRVGVQAFRANLFAVAAQSFEQAYTSDPRPETAFSIAQANRLQYYLDRLPWRIQRAVQLYQAYLAALPSGPRAGDAGNRLGELEPLLAELRRRGELVPYAPTVRTQLVVGAEVDHAAVTVDGIAVQLWQPVDVTAGSHQLVVDARGYQVERRRVVVAAGSFVPVDVPLRAKPGLLSVRSEAGSDLYIDGRASGRLPGRPQRVVPGEHFVSVTRRGRESWSRVVRVGRDQEVILDAALTPTSQRRIAGWVLGSAGILAASAGGAEGWAYLARRDAGQLDRARRDLTATPADLVRYNQRVDDARQRRTLALGLGASAVAVGVLGAGLWLFDREAPGTSSRLDLQPLVGPDEVGAVVGGRF